MSSAKKRKITYCQALNEAMAQEMKRDKNVFVYGFTFSDITSLTNYYKAKIDFNVIQREATVIEIIMKSPSVKKGRDILNELMDVYSEHNLARKNHIASSKG